MNRVSLMRELTRRRFVTVECVELERIGNDLFSSALLLDVLVHRDGGQWECTLYDKSDDAAAVHGPFRASDLGVVIRWAKERIIGHGRPSVHAVS